MQILTCKRVISEESGRNHPLAGQNRKKAEEITRLQVKIGRKRKKSQNRKKAEPACRSKSEESGRKNRKKAEEITPGGNLNLQSLKDHCVFTTAPSDTSEIALRKNVVNYVYKAYYTALDLDHWVRLSTTMPPGEASISNETEAYQFSFHGHMTSILDGHREETQGKEQQR